MKIDAQQIINNKILNIFYNNNDLKIIINL